MSWGFGNWGSQPWATEQLSSEPIATCPDLELKTVNTTDYTIDLVVQSTINEQISSNSQGCRVAQIPLIFGTKSLLSLKTKGATASSTNTSNRTYNQENGVDIATDP